MIKTGIYNLCIGVGAAFPSVFTLAQAINIPTEIIPSAQTSLTGAILAAALILSKKIVTKDDLKDVIAEHTQVIELQLKAMDHRISAHILDENRQGTELAKWTGKVSANLENQKEMIVNIGERVDRLRDR